MLIGIIESARRTDRRVAAELEGSEYFTRIDLTQPITLALRSLYGHIITAYEPVEKHTLRIPFSNDMTYPELFAAMQKFLFATSGNTALHNPVSYTHLTLPTKA